MGAGPLRVAAGVVRLRALRMRDGAQWSRMRLADRTHLLIEAAQDVGIQFAQQFRAEYLEGDQAIHRSVPRLVDDPRGALAKPA